LYNRQYFTPGNNAASAIRSAISAATAALPREADGGGYKPGALVAEEYVLSNPALNFAQFLLRAVLPTVLQVVTAIAGGYAVGAEFSQRSKRVWMRAAGGRPLVALMGKLIPLFGIFLIMMVVDAAIIHVLYGLCFRGDPVLVVASACLLLVAYLSFGALLVLLTQALATGLSLIAIFCNPAFGFVGVGFPVTAMGTFSQAWGSILPLRWYLQILFDQAARGLPTSDSVRPFLILAGLTCLYFALAWARLGAIANAPPKQEPEPDLRLRHERGVAIAMSNEARRILGDRGILGLIVLAPLAYGALYPQPYLGQVLRVLPIAVVDQDHAELSRDLVQTLDSDEAISVKARSDTIADAQAALDRHEVFAIVAIPKDTERQVLRGEQARIAAYVDAAYFLIYSRTLQRISEAASTVSSNIATHGARSEESLIYAAMARSASPIDFLSQPLFNPTGGYASYVALRQFSRPVRERLVHAPRDRDSHLHRRQPAALLSRRRLLAGRSDSRFHPDCEPHLSEQSAIDGFVRINQMGASIMEVRRDWTTLWILTIVYGLLAVLATRLASRNEAPA
jgi:ABC-2 type transport system permease protein